jgi:hypothetical protein
MIYLLSKEELESLREDINNQLKMFEPDSTRGAKFKEALDQLVLDVEEAEEKDFKSLRELDKRLGELEADPYYSKLYKRDLDSLFMSIVIKHNGFFRVLYMLLGKRRCGWHLSFKMRRVPRHSVRWNLFGLGQQKDSDEDSEIR